MVRVPILRRDNTDKNTSTSNNTNTNNMNKKKTNHSKESAERRARARASALSKWEEIRRQELATFIAQEADSTDSSAPYLGDQTPMLPPLRVCAPRTFPDSSDPKAVVKRSNAQVHAMAEYVTHCSADASPALPWVQAYYGSAAGRVA